MTPKSEPSCFSLLHPYPYYLFNLRCLVPQGLPWPCRASSRSWKNGIEDRTVPLASPFLEDLLGTTPQGSSQHSLTAHSQHCSLSQSWPRGLSSCTPLNCSVVHSEMIGALSQPRTSPHCLWALMGFMSAPQKLPVGQDIVGQVGAEMGSRVGNRFGASSFESSRMVWGEGSGLQGANSLDMELCRGLVAATAWASVALRP